MHRVLAHIDDHLSEALTLADLAAVANFSPFHFHRIFTAWMGETFGDHLRRRRLDVAALRLLTQPRTPVVEIALIVGFGSNEAFAHAFKARFGCSATEWRRRKTSEREALRSAITQSKIDQALGNPDQAGSERLGHDAHASSTHPELPMNVTVIDRPPVRVAYLRHVGPYGAAVHAFWKREFIPFLAQHQLFGRPIYGVSHDDPLIAPADKLRYDACAEVDADFTPPGGVLITTIPGGRYATTPFHGTSAAIGEAWTSLMRDWLPSSGYQLDGRPTFEHYPPNAPYDEAAGTFGCDLVLPLMPL